MRTFRYSKEFPQGKIFDTEPGREDPYPCPKHMQTVDGQMWYDSPSYLTMTTDDVVEAVVKQEMAKNSPERPKLDAEHRKKHGTELRQTTSDKKVEKSLDKPQKRKTLRLKK